MREIKFRGRSSKDNKTWFTGSFVSLDEEAYIEHYDGLRRVTEIYPVVPATVGQFTGLLDCNGKEIYEGDIIKLDDEVYAVTWDNYSGCWSVEFGDMGLALLTQYSTKNSTIIGNVHDDPEMLEATHD